MKYALWAAVLVLVGGPAHSTIGVASLQGSALRVSKARQAVYVNKAELATLHPSWQALTNMKAVLTGAGKTSVTRGTAPSRTELAARSVIKAYQALAELEASKREALRVRREALKAQKLQAAESDWKADVRNIQEAAAAHAAEVDKQNSADILNARLRTMAAESRNKAAGDDKSGVDKAAADEQLRSAQKREATVGNANDAKKDEVAALASAEIKALRDASDRRVESEVQAYEREQGKIISDGIASAKDEIARQMGHEAVVLAESMLAVSEELAYAGGTVQLRGNLNELRSAVALLQARIAKDIDVAVRDLAKQRGVTVIYQRGPKVPDMTKTFSELIRKRGWDAYRPDAIGSGRA